VSQAAAGSDAAWYRTLLKTVSDMIAEAIEPLRAPQTSTLWYTLDGGTTALATTDYLEAPIDFPCLITGWKLLARTSGAIVLSVQRATYYGYPGFTSICAAAPPTLVSLRARDDTLTGWTTAIEGDDVLAIGVTSNAGALKRVSLGLRVRKLGPGAG
jgi:hypothetical protein